jgi:hypothetical protein
MTKIKFKGLELDARDYASQGNAILGIRDSGKSYTAMFIAERLMDANIPIIAFDPIGVWRWLRVRADGKPGYPVVVAGNGDHCDLPLSPHSAPAIVRAAMQQGVSIVFDLYSMELSKADWRRIIENSVQTLLYENKDYGLRHLFVEEAAEVVPQRVGPDQGRVYSVMEKLARMGGNALLGYTLINQRAEEVNKAVLELCDGLFLHRQKGRNSLNALSKWLSIGSSAEGGIIKAMPLLPQGQCYAWPAGEGQPSLITVPKKKTFHPDRRAMRDGIKAPELKTDIPKFVTTMKSALAEIVAEAEENDPAKLKARIKELEKKQSSPVVDSKTIKEKVYEAAEIGKKKGYEEAIKDMKHTANALKAIAVQVSKLAVDVESRCNLVVTLNEVANFKESASEKIATPGFKQYPKHRFKQPVTNTGLEAAKIERSDNAGLGKAERKILNALAQYPQGRSKKQLALLTIYSSNGGGFNNALGRLRTLELIEGSREIKASDHLFQ